MIVDGLPGSVLATGCFATFPPPAETAVQIPGVYMRQDHAKAILQQIGRLWPITAAPRLDHVDLWIEVQHDVRPLGQWRTP